MLDTPRHDEISRLLKAKLDCVLTEYRAARAKADAVLKGGPSSIPHPDGSLRLRHSGRDADRALEMYMHALRQYTDFIVEGIIPEDLLR